VDDWLTSARDALVARIAAYLSRDRTNAPLLCYLVGRAQGGASIDDLAAAVRRSTS
jgi:hypothetical protein